MLDPPFQLRRTLTVDAAYRHLAFVFHHVAPAFRTNFWHLEFFLATGAQIGPHAHHRWDNLAGFLDHNCVADADVLAFDLVFIVKRRARDAAAAHCHWLEHGYRREHSGAPDLNQNIDQTRLNPFRFILVGDRPTR